MGDMQTALNKCSLMMDNLPQKYLIGVWSLRGLLNEALEHIEEAEKDFENAKKYDENALKYLEKNGSIFLTVFPSMNRLCTEFPFFDLHFPKRAVLVIPYAVLINIEGETLL